MSSVCELWFLLSNLRLYELGIFDIIKYYTKTYTFKTNEELKNGVNLWCYEKDKALEKYGDIKYWDVSKITDMSELFHYKHFFNDDISRWNVSNVKNMYYMFSETKNFNQDLNDWDVSNVEDMENMFTYSFLINLLINGN